MLDQVAKGDVVSLKGFPLLCKLMSQADAPAKGRYPVASGCTLIGGHQLPRVLWIAGAWLIRGSTGLRTLAVWNVHGLGAAGILRATSLSFGTADLLRGRDSGSHVPRMLGAHDLGGPGPRAFQYQVSRRQIQMRAPVAVGCRRGGLFVGDERASLQSRGALAAAAPATAMKPPRAPVPP